MLAADAESRLESWQPIVADQKLNFVAICICRIGVL